MGLLTLFTSWFAKPVELISYDCRGCMAQDWREIDRGVIVGRVLRKVYGSPKPIAYLIVERPDKSRFECYEGYCHKGEAYMHDRIDNPNENLEGKMVYLS